MGRMNTFYTNKVHPKKTILGIETYESIIAQKVKIAMGNYGLHMISLLRQGVVKGHNGIKRACRQPPVDTLYSSR